MAFFYGWCLWLSITLLVSIKHLLLDNFTLKIGEGFGPTPFPIASGSLDIQNPVPIAIAVVDYFYNYTP